MEVTSVKMRYQIRILWNLLDLKQKQTLMILPVVAVMSKWCKWSKQWNQLRHTLKVYAAEKEMIYLNGTSEVRVSR